MTTAMGTKEHLQKTARCAIYTRVSTDDQAKGEYSSLKAQKDICEHYISIHREEGWIVTHYFEDPGFSGGNMDRPGMQALLGEVHACNVDMIVVYKLDRISRSLKQFYDFWEDLQRHKVNFASATQQIDTGTPHGMLFLNMLLSFGQFEREQTRERTKAKLIERAKHGKWNGGWVPTGYTYDKETQKLHKKPEEESLVKEVFTQAVQLKNPTAVAKHLNKLGRRTRKRELVTKDKSIRLVGEQRFIGYRIRALVANPIYKGIVIKEGKEYPSEHPAIVSDALWQEANDALKPKPRGDRRIYGRDKHVHLLKGLLRCGHCGLSLTPYPAGKKDANGNPYLYYTCTRVSKEGGQAECPVRSIPVRAFEDLIIRYMGQIGQHPDIIKATIEAANTTKNRAIRPLKAELARIEKRREAVANAVRNCIETAKKRGAKSIGDEFIREAEKLAEEKRQLELEREKLKVDIEYRERVVTDAKVIADSLTRFDRAMRYLPPDDQKELMRLLIKEITVNHFDPEKDKDPSGVGVLKAKIRTKWYRVNITLYAMDLLSRVSEEGKISSDFSAIGSGDRARTGLDHFSRFHPRTETIDIIADTAHSGKTKKHEIP